MKMKIEIKMNQTAPESAIMHCRDRRCVVAVHSVLVFEEQVCAGRGSLCGGRSPYVMTHPSQKTHRKSNGKGRKSR